jgi:hypothetical protein
MNKEPCTFVNFQYCTQHGAFACLGPKAWLEGDNVPSATHCGKGSVMTGEKGFYYGNYCQDCISNVHRQMEPIYEADRQRSKKILQDIIARKRREERFLAQCRDDYRDLHMNELKRTSSPINYPSPHKGKWLVDLLLSTKRKEREFVSWLGWTAKLRYDITGKRFTESELQDFERCKSEARALYNDLIKFGNNKVKSKRDASSSRK